MIPRERIETDATHQVHFLGDSYIKETHVTWQCKHQEAEQKSLDVKKIIKPEY